MFIDVPKTQLFKSQKVCCTEITWGSWIRRIIYTDEIGYFFSIYKDFYPPAAMH